MGEESSVDTAAWADVFREKMTDGEVSTAVAAIQTLLAFMEGSRGSGRLEACTLVWGIGEANYVARF